MHALMDESKGVVEFPEEADQYCSPDTAQRLHEQLQQASAISKKLARLDFEVRGLLLSSCDWYLPAPSNPPHIITSQHLCPFAWPYHQERAPRYSKH